MAAKSTWSSSQKSSSFLFPEDIENLSALLEEPASIPQNTGAKPKKKLSKKASPPAEDPSTSVENQIHLEVLRKENLAMQLKIAETQLQLAQLKSDVESSRQDQTQPDSTSESRNCILLLIFISVFQCCE